MWMYLFGVSFLLYHTYRTCGGLQFEIGKTRSGELSLRCFRTGFRVFPLTSVYWRRNNTYVVKTRLAPFWSLHISESEVSDLKGHVKDFESWRNHKLLITDDLEINSASNWSCSTDEDGGYTDPKVLDKGTPVAVSETNGNLTLEVFPEVVVEGKDVTLSCSTDANFTDWEVMWARNTEPVLLTGNNSRLLSHQNFTTSNNVTRKLENVTVNANSYQHNITFIATSLIFTDSTWYCQSDVAGNASNRVTINVTRIINPVTKPTEAGSKMEGQNMPDDVLSTYIIAGSLGGVVLLGVVIAVILLVRNRKKTTCDGAQDTSTLTTKTTNSLVIEENILYVTKEDDIELSVHPTPYMVDNTLYTSSDDVDTGRGEADSYMG